MSKPKFDLLTFGEAMLRLAPPPFKRIEQTDSLNLTVGGSEWNVASDLARMGLKTAWASVLPDNPMGRMVRNKAREQGVCTDPVAFVPDGRVGCYYVEYGSSPRASRVYYDRADSAICRMDADIPWAEIIPQCKWFHTSGITPALGAACAAEVEKAITIAKENGVKTSYDLNFRAKLWTPAEAIETTARYVDKIDCCIGNEEDFQKVLGVSLDREKKSFENIDIDYYIELAAKVQETFGFQQVGISLRESHSVLKNGWSGLLYTGGKAYVSAAHELELVDRVGGGDSFSAGLICALLEEKEPDEAINFAAAYSALKHTIWGDINLVTPDEVASYLKNGGTRIER